MSPKEREAPKEERLHEVVFFGSLRELWATIGRAGRDADPEEAILFYRPQNSGVRKFQSGTGKADPQQI